MELYYTPDLDLNDPELPAEEAVHCIRVLRRKIGDRIHVTDGKGNIYVAEIAVATQKKCGLLIQSSFYEKIDPFYIHIAIAPTKNTERTEWFVEKAVEMGIHEISFIQCQFSERNILKTQRIHTKAISAVKQSVKARVPIINEMKPFKLFLDELNEKEVNQRFICHLHETAKPLINAAKPKTKSLVLIGTEGDFSEAELATALEAGFTSVSLGKSRLRTETAGLAACMTLQVLNT